MNISSLSKESLENAQTVQTVPRRRFRAETAQRRAITVWDLLQWAYQAQQVHRCGGGGALSDPFGTIEELGVTVDSSGGGFNVHEDALEVEAQIWRRLGGGQRASVIWSAKTGNRPDWMRRLPRLRVEPVRKGDFGGGKPKVVYTSTRKPLYCPIDYAGYHPDRIVMLRELARKEYARWFEGLVKLAGADWRLVKWRVAGIGVPARPWD